MAKTLTRSAGSSSGFGVDAEAAKRLLSDMLLIRRFEEKAAEVGVGLAIIVAIFRVRQRLSIDDLSAMRW